MTMDAALKAAALLQKYGPELVRLQRFAAQAEKMRRQLAGFEQALARTRKAREMLAENRALIAQAGKAARLAADPTRARVSCEGRIHAPTHHVAARTCGAGRPRAVVRSSSRGGDSGPGSSEGGGEPPPGVYLDSHLDALAGSPV